MLTALLLNEKYSSPSFIIFREKGFGLFDGGGDNECNDVGVVQISKLPASLDVSHLAQTYLTNYEAMSH